MSLPYQQTSYSDAAATTTVNQVRDVYNGLQQLAGQYQEHSGAVNTPTTPEVHYGYSSIASGSNLVSMTYPNGRILHYGYDNNSLDTAIGRVDYLADDNGSGSAGSHLADYSYLGLDSILGQADGNGVTLTESLDQFGRITDMNWLNTATSTSTDHFQYGYDRNGNVLYKNNLVNSAFSELYHANSSTTGDDNTAYDPLNRLTGFSRGTLSSSGNNGSGLDTVTMLNSTSGLSGNQQSWSLDAVGNQTSVTTDGTATSRNANSQNELTGVGSSTLAYDHNGNTTTDENGNTLTYDAWNRMVSDSAGTTSYAFDANGWRIAETHASTTSHLYFSSLGQVIEEQQGSTVTAQNVWSIDYVNDLLVRDDNSTSGNLGISGSGLGNRAYFQHDPNFNITASADASGVVQQRFVYTPYGEQTALTAAWAVGGSDSIYGFQGGRYDVATGLNHFGAPGRDYDPVTGAWVEKDGGYWDGANLYQSDNSNPLTMIDSTGLNPTTMPATQPSPTTAPSLPEGWSYGPDIALPDPDTLVHRGDDFDRDALQRPGWGNTTLDNQGNIITQIRRLVLPHFTPDCYDEAKMTALQKEIDDFNNREREHEKDVRKDFQRRFWDVPWSNDADFKKKFYNGPGGISEKWGRSSPDEKDILNEMYGRLFKIYEMSRCSDSPDSQDNDYFSKTVKKLKKEFGIN